MVAGLPSPVGFSFPDGLPDTVPSGGTQLLVDVSLESGFAIDTMEMDYQFASGGSGLVAGTEVSGTPGRYAFNLPGSTDCPDEVDFAFTATLTNGQVIPDPGGTYGALVADGSVVVGEWNGNSSTGWTLGVAGDTATDGQWDRGVVEGNGRGDPPVDGSGSPSGQAFLTDIDSGTTNSDVDGGFTTLLTPLLDATAVEGAVISYQRWFDDLAGAAPGLDEMVVSISNNGGSSWSLLETVTESPGSWVQVEFPVASVITPTSQVRLRFVISDEGDGSVVEGGVDNLRIFGIECDDSIPGDLNGDGFVNGTDLGIFLALWGTSDASADLTGPCNNEVAHCRLSNVCPRGGS